MSKAKFEAAKELIKEKRYDEARALLKIVNHPTAREWEKKLDNIAPSKFTKSTEKIAATKKRPKWVTCLTLILCSLLASVYFIFPSNQSKPKSQMTEKEVANHIAEDLGIIAGGRRVQNVIANDNRKQGGMYEVTIVYLTTESTEAGYVDEWIDLFNGVSYSIGDNQFGISNVTLMMGSPTGISIATITSDVKNMLAFHDNKINQMEFVGSLKTVDF